MDRLEKRVHVIWHHNPRQYSVSLRIEKQQDALHHAGNRRVPKRLRSVPCIHPSVDAFASLDLPPLVREMPKVSLESFENGLRQAVGKMKRHVLYRE